MWASASMGMRAAQQDIFGRYGAALGNVYIFANAGAKSGSTYNEALDTTVGGLVARGGSLVASAEGVQAVAGDAPSGPAAATAR